MSWASKLGLDSSISAGQIPLQDQTIPHTEPVQEGTFNTLQVEETARSSLDFLAALAMPLVFRYFFPPVFKAIWTWLLSYIHKERDFSQLAIGLPRGFAKTTFIKIFLLYVILFTKRQFILVCANSLPKAVAIIADVVDFLDEPNVKKVFGDWRLGLETDQQVLKKFGFRGRNIVLAAGTVDSVRGLNVKHQRPDVMLFDDIQSRADADSETVSKQIETDLYGTAMKAKSPHGCLFVFIANMYPTKWSLLRRIKENPNWIKFIAGGILSDGTSLWEDLQPIEQLLKEYENDLRNGRPEIFHAEVLNDENASINNLLDLSELPAYPYEADEIPNGSFIIIDPSNDKANSDAVSIGAFDMFGNIPVSREILEGRMSPGDTIRNALNMALRRNIRYIGIESNAYQYSLLYWFTFITTQLGIVGIEVRELYSGKYSKNSRILNMFKQLRAGEVIPHPDTRAQLFSQVTQFNPLKTNNTDGILDLFTYAPKMIELYGPEIVACTTLGEVEYSGARIWDELESSAF